jgi:hypothetical protein
MCSAVSLFASRLCVLAIVASLCAVQRRAMRCEMAIVDLSFSRGCLPLWGVLFFSSTVQWACAGGASMICEGSGVAQPADGTAPVPLPWMGLPKSC